MLIVIFTGCTSRAGSASKQRGRDREGGRREGGKEGGRERIHAHVSIDILS